MANVAVAVEFFQSLTKLTPDEAALANAFVLEFQKNPANPGISLERLSKSKSKNVWSGRIGRGLRAILHKDGDTWAIVHAGQHDAAYRWAERRTIGRNENTGALQIVESIETIREVEKIIHVHVQAEEPPLFSSHEDAYLLSLGIPGEWIPTIRAVRSEDHLLVVCEKLPHDLAERLLSLAAGELVTPPTPIPVDRPAVEAEDTRRRFYIAEDADGLAAALEAPMDRWVAFLHPSQQKLVERQFKGPAKVSGSAGTGKTVVAMHRARHLARQREDVLLTSFVTTLCENVERSLAKVCSPAELQRITVSTVHKQALGVVKQVDPRIRPASDDDVQSLLDTLRIRHAPAYSGGFVQAEWDSVVRLQGISTWDAYRRARRTGRGKGLAVKERKSLWRVFGGVLEGLDQRRLLDWPGLCCRAEEHLSSGKAKSPFTAVIVDEVQDLKPPELRFLKALCADHPGNLMVCGDAGQRIYPGGFSLSALGIEVRGRSAILRINYRTTEQIRRTADRMLGTVVDDMDGGEEKRTGTRSLLRGPLPQLVGYDSQNAESAGCIATIQAWLKAGLRPEAIGVFSRTSKRLNVLAQALSGSGISSRRLSDKKATDDGAIQLGTMHRAKGLEFKAVYVIDCGDSSMPSRVVFRGVDDPQDREKAISREQRLLYVAMTRARDELVVSWHGKPSRFLAPLADTSQEETG